MPDTQSMGAVPGGGTLNFSRFTKLREMLEEQAAEGGFNLLGVIPVTSYDAAAPEDLCAEQMLPGASSTLVFANGGGEMWARMQDWYAEAPGMLDAQPDPVDGYTEAWMKRVERKLRDEGLETRMVFPFGKEAALLPFPRLGELAGLGRISQLGILLHPEYGSWVGIRAVCFTNAGIPTEEVDESFDPCGPCDKPCASACPGAAFSERGWEMVACSKHRVAKGGCRDECAARLACPYGSEHRYPTDVIRYHHWRALRGMGRIAAGTR